MLGGGAQPSLPSAGGAGADAGANPFAGMGGGMGGLGGMGPAMIQ